MQSTKYLIAPLLEGFEWFDDALQRSLNAAGWEPVTRAESMVILHVLVGTRRPADIARALRLSRQAVHTTIGSLVKAGFFALEPDPDDGRIKIVTLAERGWQINWASCSSSGSASAGCGGFAAPSRPIGANRLS
jgi:DNA-binding MarR family transcriptional regulator